MKFSGAAADHGSGWIAKTRAEAGRGEYNRKVKLITCLLVVAFLLAGCGRNIQNEAAVRQGVLDYLQQRKAQTGLDLDSMDVSVTSVSFQKNEARATVYFKPKGSSDGMQMNYALERSGDKWVVKGRSESGANPHGAQGLPGNPHGDTMSPNSQGLPPGHPPVPESGAGTPK